jgi:hypothetical protein
MPRRGHILCTDGQQELCVMNGRLILGMILFVVGLVLSAVAIVGVGMSDPPLLEAANGAAGFADRLNRYAIPIMAGLLLAGGAVLMGLSLGNWQRPRTHHEPGDAVVNPEGYHKMKHV